jgi:hypothetical protein
METDAALLIKTEKAGQKLFVKLQAMRRALFGKEHFQSTVLGPRLSVNNRNRRSTVARHQAIN